MATIIRPAEISNTLGPSHWRHSRIGRGIVGDRALGAIILAIDGLGEIGLVAGAIAGTMTRRAFPSGFARCVLPVAPAVGTGDFRLVEHWQVVRVR